MKGSGSVNPANATSDANGNATTTLHISALGGSLLVNACVQPGSKPWQSFSAVAVPASSLDLEAVFGGNQAVGVGQNFQPVIMRATDASTPANPVLGALVAFQETIFRRAPNPPALSIGGIVINPNLAPIIIASSRDSALSDRSGLVSIPPLTGGSQGAIEIQGSASAGNGTLLFQLESFWPINPQVGNAQVSAERGISKPAPVERDAR
jgi:hypothetical protein